MPSESSIINRTEKMDVNSAAELLDVNPRTVRRYTAKGLLAADNIKGIYFLPAKEVYSLKNSTDCYNSIKNIKEIYVLSKELNDECRGLERIAEETRHHVSDIKSALNFYSWNRNTYLKQFNVQPENIFLIEEVAERLRITDKHVVYQLIDSGELKSITVLNNRNKRNKKGQKDRFFVDVPSFFDYLGEYKGTRCYTSKDASSMTRLSVTKIDRISLKYKIGRKIKPGHKNSIYLFSFSDIMDIKRIKSSNQQCSNSELQC